MKSIAVFDNDSETISLLRDAFGHAYDFVSYSNSYAAIEKMVIDALPSLFVISNTSSEPNPLEFVKLVRTLFPGIPIVVVAHRFLDEEVAEEFGATAVVRVPFDGDTWKRVLSSLVQKTI